MKKIIMLTSMAGVDFSRSVGDEHECGDDEAARLIAAGFAEPAAVTPATAEKPATAVAKASKSKGRKVIERAIAIVSGVEQRD